MSLAKSNPPVVQKDSRPIEASSPPNSSPSTKPTHTVESALELLQSLKEPLAEQLKLTTTPLSINLSRIDVMEPPRGSAKEGEAHVLWTGPEDALEHDGGNRTLHDICGKDHQDK